MSPTHGVLTIGGIISFLIGLLMLFDRADPLFRLSLRYIIPATLTTALFLFSLSAKVCAPAFAGESGSRNDGGKNGDRVNANRLARRQDFRRRGAWERGQRYADW